MYEVLTIPAINPSDQELRRAILYYDGIATLVPDDHEGRLPDSLAMAADEGLYRQISARVAWQDASVRNAAWTSAADCGARRFYRGGRLYADLKPDNPVRRRKMDAFVKSHMDDIWTMIEKFRRRHGATEPVPDVERRFAELVPDNWHWRWHRTTGLDIDFSAWWLTTSDVFNWYDGYSRYLPTLLSDWALHAQDVIPELLVATAYDLARQSPAGARLVPCFGSKLDEVLRDLTLPAGSAHLRRPVDVGHLLPSSPPGTDLAELIRFRKRHEDELRRLMIAVTRFLDHLPPTLEAGDVEHRFVQELNTARRELASAGRGLLSTRSRKRFWISTAVAAGLATETWTANSVLLKVVGLTASAYAINQASTTRTGEYDDYRYVHLIDDKLAIASSTA